MSFINLANKSFSKNSVPQKIEGPSVQEIDRKIDECRSKMESIRVRVNEIQESWKSLCEDYQCMSFAKVFDTTVKESMQKAIDDLRIEYDDAKTTLDFYKQMRNKTLLEADVRIPKDMMFDPDASGFSLKKIAKEADDKEKAERAREEQNAKRESYKERAFEVLKELEMRYEDEEYKNPSELLEIIFEEFVPSSGVAETVAGEVARAMIKILYRDYNDGDLFYCGYGLESSAGNAAAFLMDIFDGEWWDDFDSIRNRMLENDQYTKALEDLSLKMTLYIIEHPELLYEPNTLDYLKASTRQLEEDQPRYDFEIYFSDDLRELSYHEDFDIQDAVDFVENYLSWNSTYSGAEVEIWSRYDTSMTITNLTKDGVDLLEDEFGRNVDRFWEELVDELSTKLVDEDEEDNEDEEDDDLDESVNSNPLVRRFMPLFSGAYHTKSPKINAVYKILSKYGDDEDDVEDLFSRASEEDQMRMIELVSIK